MKISGTFTFALLAAHLTAALPARARPIPPSGSIHTNTTISTPHTSPRPFPPSASTWTPAEPNYVLPPLKSHPILPREWSPKMSFSGFMSKLDFPKFRLPSLSGSAISEESFSSIGEGPFDVPTPVLESLLSTPRFQGSVCTDERYMDHLFSEIQRIDRELEEYDAIHHPLYRPWFPLLHHTNYSNFKWPQAYFQKVWNTVRGWYQPYRENLESEEEFETHPKIWNNLLGWVWPPKDHRKHIPKLEMPDPEFSAKGKKYPLWPYKSEKVPDRRNELGNFLFDNKENPRRLTLHWLPLSEHYRNFSIKAYPWLGKKFGYWEGANLENYWLNKMEKDSGNKKEVGVEKRVLVWDPTAPCTGTMQNHGPHEVMLDPSVYRSNADDEGAGKRIILEAVNGNH